MYCDTKTSQGCDFNLIFFLLRFYISARANFPHKQTQSTRSRIVFQDTSTGKWCAVHQQRTHKRHSQQIYRTRDGIPLFVSQCLIIIIELTNSDKQREKKKRRIQPPGIEQKQPKMIIIIKKKRTSKHLSIFKMTSKMP